MPRITFVSYNFVSLDTVFTSDRYSVIHERFHKNDRVMSQNGLDGKRP